MDRNYCRLCLKQDTWNSPLSVFADGNELLPKIFLVHGIQILENDPFSKVICHLCLAKLEFMDGIRRKVAISNSILNGIVQAGENVLASETRAVPQMDEAETVLELLRCDKCQFTTNQASQLTAHSELHTSLASRHCPRCSLTVQTERELAHHLKTKHKNRTLAIHYCVQCAKLVYGNEQFNEHSKQHDPDSVRQHHTAKKKHKRVKSKASPVAAHRERIVLKISKTTDDNSDLTTTNPVENNRSSSSDVVIDHSDVERITPTNQTHLQRCEESQTCHNRTETTEKTQITSIERILGSEKLQTFHNRGQTTGKSQTTSTESSFKTQTTSKENSCETTGKSQTTSKESSCKTTGKSQTISKESISQTAGKSQTSYKDNFIGRSETSHTISDKVSVPKNHKTKGVSKTIQTEECRLSYLNNNIPGQSETDMNRVCVPGHTKSSHNEKHGLSASKNYERDFGSETLGCNQFGTNDASELVDLIDSENEMQTKRNNNNSRMATMDSDKIYTEQVNDNRMATSRKRLLSTDSDEMHTKQDNDKSRMSTMDSDEIHTKQENDKNRIATSRKRFSSTHLPAVGKLQRQMDFNVGGDWWDPISASQRIYIDVDKDDDVCRPPTLSSTSEVSCPSFESLELEDVIEIKDEYLSD